MSNIINIVKRNWLVIVVIVIAIVLVNKKEISNMGSSPMGSTLMYDQGMPAVDSMVSTKMMVGRQVAPSENTNRLIIQDSSLSLQVNNVEEKIREINDKTVAMGGFLINSQLSKPDGIGSGTISIRVPEAKRTEAMNEFKKMAVKVVSESVSGTDVTDQYTDLQAQLDVLQKTKVKFEDILDKAVNVSDLMNVQQQLINLQQQIDNVKGQQKYFEQSAKLSKITIYLSTDELALPYHPTNEWRPGVIFKEAVRSLVSNVRNIGSLLIWGVVYLPLIIPVAIIVWWWKKNKSK